MFYNNTALLSYSDSERRTKNTGIKAITNNDRQKKRTKRFEI